MRFVSRTIGHGGTSGGWTHERTDLLANERETTHTFMNENRSGQRKRIKYELDKVLHPLM